MAKKDSSELSEEPIGGFPPFIIEKNESESGNVTEVKPRGFVDTKQRQRIKIGTVVNKKELSFEPDV